MLLLLLTLNFYFLFIFSLESAFIVLLQIFCVHKFISQFMVEIYGYLLLRSVLLNGMRISFWSNFQSHYIQQIWTNFVDYYVVSTHTHTHTHKRLTYWKLLNVLCSFIVSLLHTKWSLAKRKAIKEVFFVILMGE